jgi:hypothetical protein
MTFLDLERRMLDELRRRIQSGAATERSLARSSRISQPHLHNVLKGKRMMSMKMADTMLRHLDLDLLTLIDPGEYTQIVRRL